MKKLISLLLLGTLLAPSFAFAVDEVLPNSNPTGTGAALNNSTQGAAMNTDYLQEIEALTDSGQMIGCQNNGAYGGSLSNTLGASLQQAIPGLLRKGKSLILSKIGSQLGPLSGVFDKALSGLFDKLTPAAQQFAQQFLGGSGAASTLGNIAGGAGGIASNALGAAGTAVAGGAEVPVKDMEARRRLEKVDAQTLGTQNASEIIVYKECIADRAARKNSNDLIARHTKAHIDWMNTGFEGGTVYVQNLRNLHRDGSDAVTEDVLKNQLPDAGLCSPYEQKVQAVLLTKYQSQGNLGQRVQCGLSNEQIAAQERGDFDLHTWWTSIWSPGASPLAALQEVENERRMQVADQLYSIDANFIASQGFNAGAEIRCTDAGTIPKGSYCDGNTSRIVNPPILIKERSAKVLGLADDALLNADEIGETIDSMMQSLTQVAFSSIEGLLSLSKSGSGGSGGSYLEDLVGQTGDSSIGAARDLVTADIEGSIEIEEAYAETIAAILKDLTDIKKIYTDAIACLQPKAGSNPTAQLQLGYASTTLSSSVNSQINSFTTQLNDSEDAIDLLTVLYTQAQGALTPEDMLDVTTAYNDLLASGIVHTTTDLTYLENDLNITVAALETLYVDASDKLALCKTL